MKNLNRKTCMNTLRLSMVCVTIGFMGLATQAQSAVIDAYFAMNFVDVMLPGVTGVDLVANLLDITYVGGGGAVYTTAMPSFSAALPSVGPSVCGFNPSVGYLCPGLPDSSLNGSLTSPSLVYLPGVTYTSLANGDGETTRTIGATVPINWDTSGAFPTIQITGITAFAALATWTAVFTNPYTVGLIPAGPNTELHSLLSGPQGDIYGGLSGNGNPISTATSTGVSDPTYGPLVGNSFGTFSFAASVPAPVPVPAAVWLFGSGLLGLIGMAQRKAA